MKRSILVLIAMAGALSTYSQLGDFQLDSSYKSTQARTYQAMVADSQLKGGPFKNLFIGKNYRREWTTPVRVPVLQLSKDFGGMKPEEEGGGKQTNNLKVIDAMGREWALRSVYKNAGKALPAELQGTIAEKIFKQGLSASYPYAALTTGTLARAAGLRYLPNTLVVIGDDPALGEFRDKFRNQLSFLELRSVPLGNDTDADTDNTFKMTFKKHESNKVLLDQTTLLRARLLDNFIGDFDRHEDQWTWLKTDSVGFTRYIPIPKDRDQAFFDINGLLPGIATRLSSTLGVFQGLQAKMRNVNTFNNSARDFDRAFLNQPDETLWNSEIDRFLASMTDAVIDEAMKRQPPEVQPFKAGEIAKILKDKRQYFKQDMMSYYRSLSRIVDVTGSNEKELFTLTNNDDGSLALSVQRMEDGQPGATIYQRVFDPAVTKEVRLYGLEDDDKFLVQGGNSPIKVRIVGGPGEDNFINEASGGNVIVYDVSFEENHFTGDGFRKKISADPMNNQYLQRGKIFRSASLGIAAELTGEGGLFLGPTLRLLNPGFRKTPYGSRHFFYVAKALTSPAWHLRWDADYIRVFSNTDLQFRSDVRLPTVQSYFFGYGNNTPLAENRSYFLARYQKGDFSLMLDRSVSNWLHIKAGPVAQFFKLLPSWNEGKYISTVFPEGSAKDHLYDAQWYAGGEVSAAINTRNHPVLTTRGTDMNFYARAYRGLSEGTGNLEQVGGRISLFQNLVKHAVVFATSFGVDHNIGDFEFPQAQYLGFKQNLRGYRFERFAGRTRAYNNTDLRISLGTANFYFFKGITGLVGFYDTGRVWMTGEESDKWHSGYGGGIWVAPFNKLVVMGTVAYSEEEKKWMRISFGFHF